MEEVAWAFSKTSDNAPFRKLQNLKVLFKWTPELDVAFYKAKRNIVEKVKDGISVYDLDYVTVLNTDWRKVGVPCAVLKKYCQCSRIDLRCCHEGWKLAFCGSKFCSPA